MKIHEIIGEDNTPTKSYCKTTPKNKMSASWLASCKNRGLVARDGDKEVKIGDKWVNLGGKKIKGEKSGGPLRDYS